MRSISAVIAALFLLSLGGAANAATLRTACAELDRSRAASCKLERQWSGRAPRAKGVWKLTTRLVMGKGNLDQVAAVEEQFCHMVRSRGDQGRLTRWSHVPGQVEGGAKMNWSCPGTPSSG